MLKYKNISNKSLTFYGVTFNPNEIKEVPGFINHIKMIRVKDQISTSSPKSIITSPKQEAPKQEIPTKRKYTRRNTTNQQ